MQQTTNEMDKLGSPSQPKLIIFNTACESAAKTLTDQVKHTE